MGTGLVMSVPAHAPKDYQALMDLKAKNHELASKLEPIPIIVTEGYGSIPAKEICEKMGVSDQSDDKPRRSHQRNCISKSLQMENSMRNVYNLMEKKYSLEEIRLEHWLQENNHLEKFPVLENAPVRCRCGAECVVKVLNNQWFLNYGDEEWKGLNCNCLDEMNILPNNIKTEFVEVIDWLHEGVCARQQGLGTKTTMG